MSLSSSANNKYANPSFVQSRSYNLKNQFKDATRTARSKSNFFPRKKIASSCYSSPSPGCSDTTWNTPRQNLKSRRRAIAEEEAGQNKAGAGRRQSRRRKRKDKGDRGEREGRVVLTDLGRCNFREDPLRRWAQLVGALTRPLSRAWRFVLPSYLSFTSSARPSLVSRFYLRI